MFKCLLVALQNARTVVNTKKASSENIVEVESHSSDEEDEYNCVQNGEVTSQRVNWILTTITKLTNKTFEY